MMPSILIPLHKNCQGEQFFLDIQGVTNLKLSPKFLKDDGR
jgi:hypothetical protein